MHIEVEVLPGCPDRSPEHIRLCEHGPAHAGGPSVRTQVEVLPG